MWENAFWLELDSGFLDMMPKTTKLKRKINWTVSKFEAFLLQEVSSRQKEENMQNGRKYL